MGRIGWADVILRDHLGDEDGGPDVAGGAWNQDVLDDPVFQDHLAFRFISQRDVAGWRARLARRGDAE